MDDTQPPIRVAVVGSGLAGLTTAYLLKNDARKRYEVTLLDQVNLNENQKDGVWGPKN